MNLIPSRTHGVLDYVVGVVLILAPFILGFANGGPEQWVPIIVGLATVLVSLVTAYELGAAKLVPYRVHLGLDVAMGVLLLLSPFVFGFAERIWWPHVLFGIVYIVVPILSQKQVGVLATAGTSRGV